MGVVKTAVVASADLGSLTTTYCRVFWGEKCDWIMQVPALLNGYHKTWQFYYLEGGNITLSPNAGHSLVKRR